MKIDKVKQLFKKLKLMHPVWTEADDNFKLRIEQNLEPVFKELETLGVARHFSESLLFWGKEFVDSVVLDSQSRTEATIEDAEAIFNGRARDLTDDEKKAAALAKKNNALVYRMLPKKDGKIGIEILTKNDKT